MEYFYVVPVTNIRYGSSYRPGRGLDTTKAGRSGLPLSHDLTQNTAWNWCPGIRRKDRYITGISKFTKHLGHLPCSSHLEVWILTTWQKTSSSKICLQIKRRGCGCDSRHYRRGLWWWRSKQAHLLWKHPSRGSTNTTKDNWSTVFWSTQGLKTTKRYW